MPEDRFGSLLPRIDVRPPAKASQALADRLRRVESRNVTYVDEGWPVFWQEARGSNVRDEDGNIYVDLTGAFGVSLLGHAHPVVQSAIREQSARLVHGMGDVHPTRLKVELLERLCEIAPWSETRGVLASTGSEAVEIALKTAQVATRRPGVLAFTGGYHGLTLGSLAVTERAHFRSGFEPRVYGGVAFAPFPASASGEEGAAGALAEVAATLERGAPNGDEIGAIIVEPVQGRAGVRMAPAGFMSELSALAASAGVLVIADEVLTGLGRCGAPLASELVGLAPDIVCLGKALGGGVPISACLARADVMDAWPKSDGEAVHTSTFLGHPLACAAALAVLDTLTEEDVAASVRDRGSRLLDRLTELSSCPGVADVRGLGLLLGVEFAADGAAARLAVAALREGLLVLPAGSRGHILELTPSVDLTEDQANHACDVLARLVEEAV